jgi:hypothetical protein
VVGPPEEVVASKPSFTGRHLKPLLSDALQAVSIDTF